MADDTPKTPSKAHYSPSRPAIQPPNVRYSPGKVHSLPTNSTESLPLKATNPPVDVAGPAGFKVNTPTVEPDRGPSSHALPGPPPASNSVVSLIQQRSKAVNELATTITENIAAFEEWLNSLPGRVEAQFTIGGLGDEMRDIGLDLILRRSGKRWSLLHVYYEPGDDHYEPKPLIDADLDTKLLAIKHFPDLLSAIKEAQEKRLEELLLGHARFNTFAESIGLKKDQEGK